MLLLSLTMRGPAAIGRSCSSSCAAGPTPLSTELQAALQIVRRLGEAVRRMAPPAARCVVFQECAACGERSEQHSVLYQGTWPGPPGRCMTRVAREEQPAS